MLLPTSSYKAVPGEMPPEVVGQKTSGRSVCGLACRSTGWRGGRRHAFSWARRRDTGYIEASGAMFFLLAASNRRLALFLQVGWEERIPIGALISCGPQGKSPPYHAHPYGRQAGGPVPRALPPPGAACAGGAPNRPRPRVRAVRPARGNPWGRSGRLHAPEAARTGPVNALRRCSSWSPPGRWLNGHNGHFLGQPTRPRLGKPRTQGGHSGPLGISNGFLARFR